MAFNPTIISDTIFTPSSSRRPFVSDTIFTPSSPTRPFVRDTIFTPGLSSSSLLFSDPFISSDILLSDSIITDSYGNVGVMSPFAPLTVSLDYSRPLLGVYDTIDTNPEVRHKMVNYYYDLVRDNWLLDELNDILNYFTYSDGKVRMISSLSDYSPKNISKDTDKIAEKKVEFISEFLLTRYDMTEILSKFTKETNTKWVNLTKHEFFLRQAVKEYLMKQITKKFKKSQKE